MKICNIHEWFSANSLNLIELNLDKFIKIYRENCISYKSSDLRLYKPLNDQRPLLLANIKENISERQWHRYPNLVQNLKCYNFKQDDTMLTRYVVIPFDNALFGILENREYRSKLVKYTTINHEECRIGLWKSPIQWMNIISESELWTDSNCLLVQEKYFDKILTKL